MPVYFGYSDFSPVQRCPQDSPAYAEPRSTRTITSPASISFPYANELTWRESKRPETDGYQFLMILAASLADPVSRTVEGLLAVVSLHPVDNFPRSTGYWDICYMLRFVINLGIVKTPLRSGALYYAWKRG